MSARFESKWTPVDIERLKALVARGLDAKIVARRLARTPDAIRRRAKLEGITFTARAERD